MKGLKRILSLFFVLATLFSFTSCKNTSENTETPKTEPTEPKTQQEQIHEAIASGDYNTAYELLYNLKDPTAEDLALMKCFRFLPVTEVKEDGTQTYTTTFTYDDRCNLLTENCTYGGDWEKHVYLYNEKNHLNSEAHTDSNGNNCYTVTYMSTTYDTSGNLISFESVSTPTNDLGNALNKPSTYATIQYTYDANGNILTCDKTYSKDEWEKQTYIYDRNNKLSYEMTDSDGNYEKILYFYDTADKLTSIQEQKGNDTTYYTYLYDLNGKLTSEVKEMSDLVIYTAYTYDGDGKLQKEEHKYSPSGEAHYTCIYSYDKYGNETQKVETTAENSNITTSTTWQAFYNPIFGAEEKEETAQPAATVLEQAKTYIAQGAYENAYILLYTKDTRSAEETALLKCFRSLPIKEVSGNTTRTCTYDSNGNLLTEEIREKDNSWIKYTYTYDENGTLVSTEYNDSENILYENSRMYGYTYDVYGNVLKETIYKKELNLIRDPETGATIGNSYWVECGWNKYDYTYDDKGNVLTATYTSKDSDYWYTYTYTYDTDSRLLKDIRTDSYGISYETVYVYNLDGNLFKEQINNQILYTYTYDTLGNLLKKTVHGTYSDYTLENIYDRTGNLICTTTVYDSGRTETSDFTSKPFYNPNFAQ